MPLLTSPKNLIEIVRGATLTMRFTVTDLLANGPFNLTGATVYLTAKDARDAKVIQKSSADAAQIDVPRPREGYFLVKFVPADTRNLPVAELTYDAWVVTQSGDRFPVVPMATLRITPAITELP